MEKASSTKDREDYDDYDDDIAQCPVLKDKLDSLTVEQKQEMRKKYEELVKPALKKAAGKQVEEDKKEKKDKAGKAEEKEKEKEKEKGKGRKPHPRLATLRQSQGSCPFMNSSSWNMRVSRAD
jgi:hypothetical protein